MFWVPRFQPGVIIDFSDGVIKDYEKIVNLTRNSGLYMEQFVLAVVEYTSQYGSENSISYTATNVIGRPSVYPLYGDFTQTYHFRTYGLWWANLPSTNIIRSRVSSGIQAKSHDYLDILFLESVCPIKLEIYEVYNPGALVKILCFCHDKKRWEVLWSGPPEVCPKSSRIFSPELKRISYATNFYRLEFCHEHLTYHYALDAVKLIGFESSLYDIREGSATSSQYDIPEVSTNPSDDVENVYEMEYTIQSKLLEENQICHIEHLPNEVLLLILSYLDLASLCATAKVSRHFKKLSYDSVLYCDLDLQPYWAKVDSSTLKTLQKRCPSLRHLNLSWCGAEQRLSVSSFSQFLENSCSLLSCLKLSNCTFIGYECMKIIADACPLLQVLELRNCRNPLLIQASFMEITRLVNLRYLDFYRTNIGQHQLLSIISCCWKLEHLFVESCLYLSNFDEIAVAVANNLSRIKTLDFRRAKSLTNVGVSAIASKCHDLIEIDLGWCLEVDLSNGCIVQLVNECCKLKKLFLTAIRTVSDAELLAIAKNASQLEQLDILGTLSVNINSIERVLHQCRNLKLLDISFCGVEVENALQHLKSCFPQTAIICSIRGPSVN